MVSVDVVVLADRLVLWKRRRKVLLSIALLTADIAARSMSYTNLHKREDGCYSDFRQ